MRTGEKRKGVDGSLEGVGVSIVYLPAFCEHFVSVPLQDPHVVRPKGMLVP